MRLGLTKYKIVVADFKTVAAKFVQQGNDPSVVNRYIESFRKLKDSNKIQGLEDKNIDNWGKKSFEDFKKFVDKLSETKTKTQVKKETRTEGAKLVAENEEWRVYQILDLKACMLYGANTQWCITQKDGKHWREYHIKGYGFYFLISKTLPTSNPNFKIALAVREGGRKIFDANDHILQTLPDGVPEFKIIIPPFNWEYFRDGGSYNVAGANLMTLKGAPEKVDGNFYCGNNQLTSLEGAPKEVGGSFDCSYNKLTSLEGTPKEVGGNFHCSRNKLTSLKGAPEKVGNFNCKENQLTSLEGAPKEVKGFFDCSHNKLTSLEGAPEKVGGDFFCIVNQLTSLEGAPEKVGGDFYCSLNKKKFTEAEVRAVCNVKGKVVI